MRQRIMRTSAPAAIILIRLIAGAVFLSEGIQKFLFSDQLGAGRFLKIGLPMPVRAPRHREHLFHAIVITHSTAS